MMFYREDIFADFSDMSYADLAKVNIEERLMIAGTCFANDQGVGATLPAKA